MKKLLSYSTILAFLIVIIDHILTLKGLRLGYSEGNPFLLGMANYFNMPIQEILAINFLFSLLSVYIIWLCLDYMLEKELPHVFIMFYVVYGFLILLRLVIIIEWIIILSGG